MFAADVDGVPHTGTVAAPPVLQRLRTAIAACRAKPPCMFDHDDGSPDSRGARTWRGRSVGMRFVRATMGKVGASIGRLVQVTASAVVGAVLRRPWVVRLVPPDKLFTYVAARCVDPDRTARDSIQRLKALRRIEVRDLISSYVDGMLPFGMYHEPDRYFWAAPGQRGLVSPESARVSRSIRRQMNAMDLEFRFDHDFEAIVRRCMRADGTWLNEPIVDVLLRAADVGLCTAVGGYRSDVLVAGEFGLILSGWYVGMSKFHDIDGAGTVLTARIISEVAEGGRYVMIDIGEMRENLVRFGAFSVSEDEFAERLVNHLTHPPSRVTGG
jgi:leucyl/phenylalanyl-tRNA--protein transferase